MIDLSFSIQELEYFLLILTRITCFVYLAPFFGATNVPNRVKIALSVFFSFLVYELTMPHVFPAYADLLEYTILILKEAITGLLIGFGANICSTIVNFAGHLADMEMGLSMASMFDPTTKQSSTVSGVLYQNGFMLILIVTGFYRYLLKALVETFTLIEIGGASINLNSLNGTMITFLGEYMILGFRIALPIISAAMLLNAVLAILAKIAPQMNMFAVGMQLKIIVGFMILFLTIGMMPKISDFILKEIRVMITRMVEGLM